MSSYQICEKKKKKKKNTKKIRWTLKAHVLGTAWWIQLKLGIGGAPPRAQKILCVSAQGSFELQMHENGIFFTPIKYTLVCPIPKVSFFSGRTTHYRVSWCTPVIAWLVQVHMTWIWLKDLLTQKDQVLWSLLSYEFEYLLKLCYLLTDQVRAKKIGLPKIHINS